MSMKFGSYWKIMFQGEMLYYNIMNLAVIFTCILFTILPFYVPILLIVMEVMFTNYMILKKNYDLTMKHAGERYLDSHTIERKDFREDMIYAVRHYHPINIITIEKSMDGLKKTDDYKNAEVIILRQKALFKRRRDTQLKEMQKWEEEDKKRARSSFEKRLRPKPKPTEKPQIKKSQIPLIEDKPKIENNKDKEKKEKKINNNVKSEKTVLMNEKEQEIQNKTTAKKKKTSKKSTKKKKTSKKSTKKEKEEKDNG